MYPGPTQQLQFWEDKNINIFNVHFAGFVCFLSPFGFIQFLSVSGFGYFWSALWEGRGQKPISLFFAFKNL